MTPAQNKRLQTLKSNKLVSGIDFYETINNELIIKYKLSIGKEIHSVKEKIGLRGGLLYKNIYSKAIQL